MKGVLGRVERSKSGTSDQDSLAKPSLTEIFDHVPKGHKRKGGFFLGVVIQTNITIDLYIAPC